MKESTSTAGPPVAGSFPRIAEVVPDLEYTGERLVPGKAGEALFREHEARYIFAGKFVRGMRVLDVACGSGIGTQYLLQAGAHSCIGLDIDRAATDYATAKYKDCIFIRCDATSLCVAKASVDVIVSFETIEHVKEQKAFLLECRRVLRPGGTLVCSTPNRALSRWGDANPFHLQEFSIVEFSGLLGQIFADVQLYAQSNALYLPYVSRKVLLRLLERLQLTEPIRRLLRRKPVTMMSRTEFGRGFDQLESEILPHRASLMYQPMFVIAVARKALG
jgi:ubiquinone/menaquinone biosynthesis C-methylase UbiE